MKTLRMVLLGMVLAMAGTSAYAHGSVGLSINLGYPAYYPPPTVYYSPPPVAYYPPPPAVYYEPIPGYYEYYGPRAYFRYDEPRFGYDHRHWRHHDRHDRHWDGR